MDPLIHQAPIAGPGNGHIVRAISAIDPPTAFDLYCGLGGWTDGFLAAGYQVYGLDNHRHEYAAREQFESSEAVKVGGITFNGYREPGYKGVAFNSTAEKRLGRKIGGMIRYPGQLILQDALTIHGSQLKDAAVIVCSPPCQNYSYLAMPWSRSKCPLCKGSKVYFEWQLITGVAPGHMTEWGRPIPCDCKENSRKAKELRADWEKNGPDNRLFDACFRIQREALISTGYICEACGAPDEPRIEMTAPAGHQHSDDLAEYAPCSECLNKSKRYIPLVVENVRGAIPWVGKRDMPLDEWNRLTQPERIKLGQPQARFGSFMLWGDVAQIGNRVVAGRDLADIRAGRGRFGMGVAPERGEIKVPGQIQGKEYAMCRTGAAGQKTLGHVNKRDGHGHTRHLTNQAESDAVREAVKIGGDWFSDPKSTCRKHASRSNARKAASAMIAKIPLALSAYIAEVHKP